MGGGGAKNLSEPPLKLPTYGVWRGAAVNEAMGYSLTMVWRMANAREASRGLFRHSRYRGTEFVHGMRGWAALGVLFIHSGGGGLRKFGEWGNSIVDLGSAGVYVFFVISGFAVATSWNQSSAAGGTFGTYLLRRLVRIVPLYYFWIFVSISTGLTATYWQEAYGVKVGFYNVIAHLSFLSAFDGSIAASIIGVEWSLAIEVFYYLIIPGMVAIILRRPALGALLLVFGVLIWELLPITLRYFGYSQQSDLQLWLFSPLPWMFSFVLGILAFQYRERNSVVQARGAWPLALATVWLVLWIFVPGLSNLQILGVDLMDRYLWISFLTAVIILLLRDDSVTVRLLFLNPFIYLAGSLSYGIYLSHIVILRTQLVSSLPDVAKLLVTLIVSFVVSFITWVIIEHPAISGVKQAIGARKP